MFDNKIELSTDLEWMLQSGQAKTPSLVRTLVREHYRWIFEQALRELSYPKAARQAADEIIQSAVQQTDRYRSEQGVRFWLEEIASSVLQRRKAEIRQLSLLNPRLNQSLLQQYPLQDLTAEQIEQAAERLADQILTRRHLLDRRASAQEILIACLAVVLVFGLLRAAGILPFWGEETPNANLVIQADQPARKPVAPSSLEGSAFHPLRGIPPQAPLSLKSSHEDVWRRMLLSRFLWQSLWADLVVVLYGPEGYIGPPQAERHQVWIEQDQHALLVSGPPYSGPERIEQITPNGSFPQLTPFLQGVADISRLGSQIPWFYLSEDTIFSSPYLINFFFMGHNDWPPLIKEFQIVKTEQWAGREAVVVEQTNRKGELEARLWLDAATGLILREQYFAPGNPDRILLETVVTAVAYNRDFPDDLFTSPEKYAGWNAGIGERGSLSFSAQGEPYPWLGSQFSPEISPERAPPGFDPSNSQLRFVYAGDIFFGPARATEVQVLADNYTLGKIKINHLFKTTCIRSPDGRRIGLFTQDNPPSLLSDMILLYELANLRQIPLTFPGNMLVRAAFSPDSRRLAVAGIDSQTTQSNLFVVDLATGVRQELKDVAPVYGLAWSPDGRRVAALHWPSFRQTYETIVQVSEYDLESTKTARYNLAADLDWGSTKVTIPLEDWQATFQLPMGGLEACAAVPGLQEPIPAPQLPPPSDLK